MDKAELKQNIRKVKKFLKERDYSKIDIGIELIRSLNEPNIFKELLEGTLIEEDGVLKKNKTFTGSGPAEPYLYYSVWNLIGYAPDDAKLDKSIVRKNIKTIRVHAEKLPNGIFELVNLEQLRYYGAFDEIGSNISQLKNLRDLVIFGECNNIDFIRRISHIETLSLSRGIDEITDPGIRKAKGKYGSIKLKNIDSLDSCKNLKYLDLGNTSLENLDGIIHLPKLTELHLNRLHHFDVFNIRKTSYLNDKETIEISRQVGSIRKSMPQKHLDSKSEILRYIKERIGLVGEYKSVAYPGAPGSTNSTKLLFPECPLHPYREGEALGQVPSGWTLENRDEVIEYQRKLQIHKLVKEKDCKNILPYKNIKELDFSYCRTLKNLDALRNFKELESLNLSYCVSLENIDGLYDMKNLRRLNLSNCVLLQDVDSLNSLNNLTELSIENAFLIKNLDISKLISIESLNISSCSSLKSLSLPYNKSITELYLNSCTSLTSLSGIHKWHNLTFLNLYGCWSLQNIDDIAKCKKLERLDLSFCQSLESISKIKNLKKLRELKLEHFPNSPQKLLIGEYNHSKPPWVDQIDFSKYLTHPISQNEYNQRMMCHLQSREDVIQLQEVL